MKLKITNATNGETYIKEFDNTEAARDWVTSTLDLSLVWKITQIEKDDPSSNDIRIITVIEEYEIVQQYAFTNSAKAIAFFDELEEQYFGEFARKNNMPVDEYQGSIQWWDDDSRVRIHYEAVIVDGEIGT